MAGGSLGGGNNNRRIISEINVTPLVDIMLVLLIIFMVTASYIVRDSIEVKLPEASTGEASKVTLLEVKIAAGGKLALNGKETTTEKIREYIKEMRGKGKSLEAVIAADEDAKHGAVVKVIDLVRAEGIKKFGINVIKPKQAK